MKRKITVGFLMLSFFAFSQQNTIDQKVNALLKKMTIEEKIGQLNQYTGDNQATGPITINPNKEAEIKQGLIGSMLNVLGTKYTRQYQELAMQSRLKIPLLFAQDVIHGYKTSFPIPLAEAASWDLAAMELSARVAATQAAASGIHWTFAPMVDIGRDPRWGRVMEGAGEDTYLGSRIAAARVKGIQGKLGDVNSVLACVKHFAAYGAAIGGRDYNSVDMSERMLWETYLPPFKSALDAGAATFMNSFNDLNGIPATGNKYLQRDILKGKWNFQGFVVSDWGSIGEMVAHGYVKDNKEAALSAITAGSDMDMESNAYRYNLAQLVKENKVSITLIDDAVRRILRKKFELGLFEDPYKYCNTEREQRELNNPEHRKIAREVAAKSIVLLKNENDLLPIAKSTKKIAFIGPMVKEHKANMGFWAVDLPEVDYNKEIVSQWEGLKNKVGKNAELLYAKGCEIDDNNKEGFAEAVATAMKADVVILSIGERWDMSGEAKSRSNIHLPGVQEELVKAIQATGKPVVVLINAGRPLVFNWTADSVPAILYTWWLGSEAGNAIADVLFGDYNPSAKLPMTFPRDEGQIPIYYNHFNTGRPAPNDTATHYVSAYIDLKNSPKFPFGFGLSYTQFEYSNLKLSQTKMKKNETIELAFQLKNTGKVAGEEVVQLYLRDKVGSVVRPVIELKDFQKIKLNPGETKTIRFSINKEKLSFYGKDLNWIAEPGDFDLMIGSSSTDIRLKTIFELIE
ncbi:glycoside hydrolase family 3 N-terminal domain-containing protein [Flavobacterium sp. NG2]|uniref:glycoside hydrolase family 3 N-terminal domain-containing protein n=1 Tax=Flavobacterium sp. NG2 TaxID=3097547 RepID=UPI002A8053FB|nr:glycoside hydrolase family 3 N-terminal domain-containing protein [Flavobacterium sp. NG2]WPR72653.1 glycoside hydrolase family 3 N-terminal domain-containing protein [Flavobacterium sp. NG2]